MLRLLRVYVNSIPASSRSLLVHDCAKSREMTQLRDRHFKFSLGSRVITDGFNCRSPLAAGRNRNSFSAWVPAINLPHSLL
jgi:hypothetical protein